MTDRTRIQARSSQLIKQGKVGDGIKLGILASEVKTVRYGDEIKRH